MPTEKAPSKGKQEIDMRKTKLKASEAALLAGELSKPSWQSRNEGIHERVSFEDSIWGFDLAGGSFYKTPLRVTAVKPDSRAEKAGIRPGDKLLRINDIDTSTLTIQEAHEIIIESGIYLRIAVTAPEDEEDSYFCWEDPLQQSGYDSDEERRRELERAKKREVHAKVSSYWSLQWPWVSKRRVIYRESNCFMVPSKYETKHRDKFPLETKPGPKVPEDIVLNSASAEKGQNLMEQMKTGSAFNDATKIEESKTETDTSKVNDKLPETKQAENESLESTNSFIETENKSEKIVEPVVEPNVEPAVEPIVEAVVEPIIEIVVEQVVEPDETLEGTAEDSPPTLDEDEATEETVENDKLIENPELVENDNHELDAISETDVSELHETSEETIVENSTEIELEIVNSQEVETHDDEILDEMLGASAEMAKEDEDTVFNDILNESDAQSSQVIDENQR